MYNWEMATLPVDVLWIARYDYRPGWTLRTHRHKHFQMIFFLDGKGTFTIKDTAFPIHSSQLFLIHPGETHGLRARSMVRTLDVKFRVSDGPLARQLRRAASELPWNEPGLSGRLERIRAEGELKTLFYRELCSVLLTEILYLFLRQKPNSAQQQLDPDAQPPAHDPILERATACIRGSYQQQLSVREIASASGCTERTLRLHFHAAMQLGPLHFLQRFRIAKAKSLIQYSDYALKEIAEQVGFQTVHHFTRIFSSVEGRSPAAWRREYLEGIRKDVYINPRFENRDLTVPGDKPTL